LKKRVIVIDDKPMIRQSIVQTIDWAKWECEVVAQAEDGLEGMEMIRSFRPDVLITDIKMPGHSGLDLAEHMQSACPSSKTILITGYQDFEYAQRAVRLGVADFILKPIRNEELEQAIGAAVKELDEQRSQEQSGEAMKQAYSQLTERHLRTVPSVRAKLCADLLSGNVPEDIDPDDRMREGGRAFVGYVAIHVSLRHTKKAPDAGPRGATGNIRSSGAIRVLIDRALRIGAKMGWELIGFPYQQQLILVVMSPKSLSTYEWRARIMSFCEEFTAAAPDGNEEIRRMAVSSTYKSLRQLKLAYEETERLHNTAFFGQEAPVVFPQSLPAAPAARDKLSIMRDLEQFNQWLERTNNQDLVGYLEQFLSQIAKYSGGNILVAKGLLSEVCLAAARHYFRVTGDEFGLDKSIDEVLYDIYRLGSMREASNYLAAFIQEIKRKLGVDDKGYSLMVKQVIDYLNANFAESISLTGVAEHFGLSPSYLSRLLRAETGINFVDLVSKARIEAAKRLLRNPRLKVNEVGERVGYKEYAYFYQVFKKIEGMSPKEFKNRNYKNPLHD